MGAKKAKRERWRGKWDRFMKPKAGEKGRKEISGGKPGDSVNIWIPTGSSPPWIRGDEHSAKGVTGVGKLLIFSDVQETRELLAQEFGGDGHLVVTTGNPALIPGFLRDLNPTLLLMDFHLKKVSPWQMMRQINKESPHLLVLPYTAYSGQDGNLRLVLAHPKGGRNLTLQAFRRKLDPFLNPESIAGDGRPMM
jgi:CheY-like chemotaxis protein